MMKTLGISVNTDPKDVITKAYLLSKNDTILNAVCKGGRAESSKGHIDHSIDCFLFAEWYLMGYDKVLIVEPTSLTNGLARCFKVDHHRAERSKGHIDHSIDCFLFAEWYLIRHDKESVGSVPASFTIKSSTNCTVDVVFGRGGTIQEKYYTQLNSMRGDLTKLQTTLKSHVEEDVVLIEQSVKAYFYSENKEFVNKIE
uniref:Uncharacterized protein n=1 Tax=Glossina palpalis gambiensis TaxID=67801 RepID=A0A1B0BLJ3_9MUSC